MVTFVLVDGEYFHFIFVIVVKKLMLLSDQNEIRQ